MGILNSFMEKTSAIFLPFGWVGLFFYSFIEASISPFPVEILLIPLSLASPDNALFFALIATVGSVAGAIFGYYIGYFGKIIVLEKLFSEIKIKKMHEMYNKYESWAVFIAGFTPIPYKLVTLTGGALYINFKKFVFFSILSRGLRFFLEAIFIIIYGQKVVDFLDKNFEIMTIIFVAVLIIGYYIYKKFK